jgi:hypothetical protein
MDMQVGRPEVAAGDGTDGAAYAFVLELCRKQPEDFWRLWASEDWLAIKRLVPSFVLAARRDATFDSWSDVEFAEVLWELDGKSRLRSGLKRYVERSGRGPFERFVVLLEEPVYGFENLAPRQGTPPGPG